MSLLPITDCVTAQAQSHTRLQGDSLKQKCGWLCARARLVKCKLASSAVSGRDVEATKTQPVLSGTLFQGVTLGHSEKVCVCGGVHKRIGYLLN